MSDSTRDGQRQAFFGKFPRLAPLDGTIYKDTSQEWVCECCGVDIQGQEAKRIGQFADHYHGSHVQSVLHTCEKCWKFV